MSKKNKKIEMHDCNVPMWPNGSPRGPIGRKWECAWCWDKWTIKDSGEYRRWDGKVVKKWKRKYVTREGMIKPDPKPITRYRGW